MEESLSPIPAPRTKLPIPLPRTKLVLDANDEPSEVTEVKQTVLTNDSKGDFSISRPASSLRKSLRQMTVNVHGKSSSVIENTKLVGAKIEKSVKNILKRHSSASNSENDNTDNECAPIDQEINHIFKNLKFGSPIVSEDPNLPPPYPPPPLPEDIYDEISSNASSAATSHYSSPSKRESVYEEIPFMKKLSPTFSQDSDTESFSVENKSGAQIFRSDSWNYFTENTPKELIKSVTETSSTSTSESGHYAQPCEVLHSYENFIPSVVSKPNFYSDDPQWDNCQNPNSGSKTDSIDSSRCSIVNSVYENWGPCHGEDLTSLEKTSNTKPLLLMQSDNVICEFDPLFKENPILQQVYESRIKFQENPVNIWEDDDDGISHLSKFGGGDYDEKSTTESVYELASNCSEGSTPLKLNEESVPLPEEGAGNSVGTSADGINGKKVARWSSMRRAVQKVVKDGSLFKRNKSTESPLPSRPTANLPTAIQTGYLYKGASMMELPKHLVKKWCQLGEGKISFSSDKNTPAKDTILLDNISAIQLILDPKLSEDGEVVHCWELVHSKGKPTIVGCSAPTERRIWMSKILESLTQAFPSSLMSSYSRAGWTYLRESISGPWHIAWLLLQKRTLHYSTGKGCKCEVDLRKVINIELSAKEDSEQIVVDTQEKSIRLQVIRDTKAWSKVIKTAAVDNGTGLSDQQLTKDNVPTIVDKCISFIYAHGCMTEGIYRRSGSNASIQKLLTDLRKDSWGVRLSREEYTEHDVSTALKRFFRDLSDPLFTSELHDYLCNAASIKCNKSDKISMYRNSLEKLPVVNYVTARKLMSHLHFISQLSSKNLMNTDNLAAIWAPTLMHVQDNDNSKWNRQEFQVVHDLITFFKPVFMIGESELAVEKRIAEVLEAVHSRGGPATNQPSGHLKIWVYIGSKEKGSCINVTVEADRLAGDVVLELCSKYSSGLESHKMCLQEVVLGGSLSRCLHHSERVFDTVIRWAYWHHDHRKDNYLLLTSNDPFGKIAEAIISPPLSKMDELKFATPKIKSVKTHYFEFSQAKLSYYKDSKHNVKLGEWRVEDVIFYLGHDPKRNLQAKWSLTIVPKEYASLSSKEYNFGFILGGNHDDLYEWLSAFFLAQYKPEQVLPSPAPLIP